ncbi:MAG: trigger factor [Endomicrobiales bacterium]|nr:trigger factor [Endomicrobiales bacterium]
MENLKVEIVEKKPCSVILNIEVPQPEVKVETEKVYQEIQRIARVSGFRQGKAPMEMIKKNYVDNAREKVLENLIQKSVFPALKSKGIEPIAIPSIQEVNFDFDKPLKFKVKTERSPEFKSKDYKGVKIVKEIRAITKEKIGESIDALREKNAKLVESKKDVVEPKSYVMVDYEGYKDSQEIKGLKAKNQLLDLSASQLIMGFKDGLLGAKKGEEKEIKVKFPKEHPDKKLADQDVIFKARIKEIKEKELPALDDELAKDFNIPSLKELESKVKESLEQEEKRRQEQDVRDKLIEHLLSANKFEVPDSLVEEQLKYMIERMSEYFKSQGMPESSWKENSKEWNEKYRKEAEQKVRIAYILSDIAKIEKIEVTEDDLKSELENMKKRNPDKESAVEKYFEKNKESIISQLKDDKLFKFLLDNAKIKEKTIK